MFVVKFRKIFFAISIVLFALSIFAISKYGLNYGIDFKGGSILEIEYSKTGQGVNNLIPENQAVKNAVSSAGITGDIIVMKTGDAGFIIRTKEIQETERQALLSSLGTLGSSTVKRFDSVGPVLGKELQGKALWSIIFVILAIVLFITYAFRHVSKPVSSWKYGLVAVIALLHDVIIPTGLYAFLGRSGGYEIDALFVTALLVILGFSVHDTIVVFDRTRENLKIAEHGTKKPFMQIVGESVSQTFSRSINTSLTTILALVALYIFGPVATRSFSFVLIIGIAIGTYSSIFIGSPLLVTLESWQNKK